MKLLKYVLLLIAVAAYLPNPALADDDYCDSGDLTRFEQDLNEKDWDALYDYLKTKRTMNVQEKACNLTIAGDVRVDWRHTNEQVCDYRVRGGEAVRTRKGETWRVGRHDFDIEFNLYFDYVCDRNWAVVQLEFDDSAGVSNVYNCIDFPAAMHGSGKGCDINLKKAYMGYNICSDGCTRFDIELGRRKLYHVFDSEVQFLSRFDGVLLKYDSCWDCWGDWYVHAAGFVVDYRVNHFAFVIEGGLLNICDSGIDFKYSFIDWRKNGKNVCQVRDPVGTKFQVNQFTMAYHFIPEYICMPAKVFGAFLWNADYKRNFNRNRNVAWYAGFKIGEVVYEGDWAFKAQYQYVEQYAVPDQDMSGIGNGNALNSSSFYPTPPGNGNTNFQGFRLEALYALTDNLSLDTRWEWSREIDIDAKIGGGKNKYSQFRLEAIYAF